MNEGVRKLVLEGKSLIKTFRVGDGSIEVLSKADIALEEASSMSIRGDSGCGKTTLLNLLARLEDADEGKIAWGGRDGCCHSLLLGGHYAGPLHRRRIPAYY